MSSLQAFLKDFNRLRYSVDEIVDRYLSWVDEDTYMILSKWNKEKGKMMFSLSSVLNVGMMFIVAELKESSKVYAESRKISFFSILKIEAIKRIGLCGLL